MITTMNNSTGQSNQATTTIGPSLCLVEAPTQRWIKCLYNGKPRIGLDMGPDPREGTNNRIIITLDGIRTLNVDKMVDVKDVTTVGDYA